MTDSQLVSLIIAAYTLSQDDITSLAESITTHRLNVMQASYRRAQVVTGLVPNWTPGQAVQRRIEKQSQKDAQGIAATYKQYLTSFVETALEVEKAMKCATVKGWRDVFGSVKEAVRQMVSNVGEWLSDFMGWKPKQVANATCGGGLSDGTMQFAQDVVEADKGDGTVQDDNGDTIVDISEMSTEITNIGIIVLPEESSSDVCALVAGKTFTMAEYSEIYNLVGTLPAHANCPHYASVIRLD